MRQRFARYEVVKENEVLVESQFTEDADIVVVAYGATARIVNSAVKSARAKGLKVGVIRPITLWPFPEKVIAQAADSCKAMLCVEMSMGQMVDDVRLAANGKVPVHFFGRTGGVIPTPAEVLAEIEKIAGGVQ